MMKSRIYKAYRLLSIFGYTLLFEKTFKQECCCCEEIPGLRFRILPNDKATTVLSLYSSEAIAKAKALQEKWDIERIERIERQERFRHYVSFKKENDKQYNFIRDYLQLRDSIINSRLLGGAMAVEYNKRKKEFDDLNRSYSLTRTGKTILDWYNEERKARLLDDLIIETKTDIRLGLNTYPIINDDYNSLMRVNGLIYKMVQDDIHVWYEDAQGRRLSDGIQNILISFEQSNILNDVEAIEENYMGVIYVKYKNNDIEIIANGSRAESEITKGNEFRNSVLPERSMQEASDSSQERNN